MIHFHVSYVIATMISMSQGMLLPEKHLEKRMYGGFDVSSSSKYPFVVNMVHRNDLGETTPGCAGVIIGVRSVLTAGHCLFNKTDITTIVRAGSIQPNTDVNVVDKRVINVNIHPNYTGGSSTRKYDIALLTVDSDFHESEKIRILPVETEPYADRCWQGKCVMMGWGYYETLENEDELHKGIREGWTEYDGHLYKLLTEQGIMEKGTWWRAKHRCEEEGGYLADIQTERENIFLAVQRPDPQPTRYVGTWIGLRYGVKPGRWAFSRKDTMPPYDPYNFNGFAYGQPKNPEKVGSCGAIAYWNKTSPWENGKWKNYDCDDARHDFWCEKDLAYKRHDYLSAVLREFEVSLRKDSRGYIAFAQDLILNEERHDFREGGPGDSGGPLVCKLFKDPDNPANPRWRLFGIYVELARGRNTFVDPTAVKFW